MSGRKSGDWPGLAVASSCCDDDGHAFHGEQEFAEHFMVQIWREGRQVWEDYRDAQVRNFLK